MRCAWQAYLNLLPHWMRQPVDDLGKDTLQELRIRLEQPTELVMGRSSRWLEPPGTRDDLNFCINAASKYSPWAAGTTAQGYLTGAGGHRMGICGQATVVTGAMTGIASPTSICLRVARDFPGIAGQAAQIDGSILILGPPGSGKTTLLRDLIREKSNRNQGAVSVVDEKQEIFPSEHGQICFPCGKHTDIISGCPKAVGIEAVLRNMGPKTIAVDEITAPEDCTALLHAGWCGVNLLATAHAASVDDLHARPVYKPLVENKLFDTVIVLQSDKSWRLERMKV